MSLKIKFNSREHADFITTLKERVNEYFEKRKTSKFGNWQMYAKLIFFFGGMIAIYLVLISDLFNPIGTLLMWMLLGLFIAFNGFNVAHDAVHGAFSKY